MADGEQLGRRGSDTGTNRGSASQGAFFMKSICDPPSPGPSHLTGDVTEPQGHIGITFARCASATVLCLALGVVSIADALAGGAGLYEIATPDLGLAAAGYAARAQDASTLLTNPAGMTRLRRSELMAGAQVLYGDVKFSPNSQTSSFLGDGVIGSKGLGDLTT